MSSLATMSAVGVWTGITETLHMLLSRKKNTVRITLAWPVPWNIVNLVLWTFQLIGLGCLPMVGYYGGKYDKHEMIALIRRAYDEGVTSLIQPKCTGHIPAKNG